LASFRIVLSIGLSDGHGMELLEDMKSIFGGFFSSCVDDQSIRHGLDIRRLLLEVSHKSVCQDRLVTIPHIVKQKKIARGA